MSDCRADVPGSMLDHGSQCNKEDRDSTTSSLDVMLSALASVVVDELIRMKMAGMKPAQIEAIYGPQEVSS